MKEQKSNTVENGLITEQEIKEVQEAWGKGIVEIGKAFSEGRDYIEAATKHINDFYAYDQLDHVLFKPTLAHIKQFRLDFEGALSYFVGGNPNYPEDNGFAIAPWTNVRWDDIKPIIFGNTAMAMGNYYFTPKGASSDADAVKVEYSFGYMKDDNANLRIALHHSSYPYSPDHSPE